MTAVPDAIPVRVTVQTPFLNEQELETKETIPVPPTWDQSTVPVGAYPPTLATHVIVFDHPPVEEAGLQETLVLEALTPTSRPYVPAEGKLRGSPK